MLQLCPGCSSVLWAGKSWARTVCPQWDSLSHNKAHIQRHALSHYLCHCKPILLLIWMWLSCPKELLGLVNYFINPGCLQLASEPSTNCCKELASYRCSWEVFSNIVNPLCLNSPSTCPPTLQDSSVFIHQEVLNIRKELWSKMYKSAQFPVLDCECHERWWLFLTKVAKVSCR